MDFEKEFVELSAVPQAMPKELIAWFLENTLRYSKSKGDIRPFLIKLPCLTNNPADKSEVHSRVLLKRMAIWNPGKESWDIHDDVIIKLDTKIYYRGSESVYVIETKVKITGRYMKDGVYTTGLFNELIPEDEKSLL